MISKGVFSIRGMGLVQVLTRCYSVDFLRGYRVSKIGLWMENQWRIIQHALLEPSTSISWSIAKSSGSHSVFIKPPENCFEKPSGISLKPSSFSLHAMGVGLDVDAHFRWKKFAGFSNPIEVTSWWQRLCDLFGDMRMCQQDEVVLFGPQGARYNMVWLVQKSKNNSQNHKKENSFFRQKRDLKRYKRM